MPSHGPSVVVAPTSPPTVTPLGALQCRSAFTAGTAAGGVKGAPGHRTGRRHAGPICTRLYPVALPAFPPAALFGLIAMPRPAAMDAGRMTTATAAHPPHPTIARRSDPLTDLDALLRRPVRRVIRRSELRRLVPLGDTTIYQLERRGEFPRRFFLSARCVVWDLAEVEDWIEGRRRASDAAAIRRPPAPDVRQRRTRPVRHKR